MPLPTQSVCAGRERKSSQVVPDSHTYAGPSQLTTHPCVVANAQTTGVRERGSTLLVASRTRPTNGSSVHYVYGAGHFKSRERDTPTDAVYLVRFEWTCEHTRPTSVRRSWSDRAQGNDTPPQTADGNGRVHERAGEEKFVSRAGVPHAYARPEATVPVCVCVCCWRTLNRASHKSEVRNSRLQTARPCECA